MSESPKNRREQSFRMAWEKTDDGAIAARLEGVLAFADCELFWDELREKISPKAPTAVRFDLGALDAIDGGTMALLVQAKRDFRAAGVPCEISGAKEDVAKILALYDGEPLVPEIPPPRPTGVLSTVGDWAADSMREAQIFLAFLGGLILAVGGVFKHPRTGNFREVASIMARTGADAVPIVALITFLIGFVMAFQSAAQLRELGANIYVADLVGLSITRELGPLMTAIIVCGRSGAAFAAELGTMRVSEEIDALRTMGIGPLRFLVFPRVFALLVVVPVLALLGDLVGIAGGLIVGVANLDLTVTGYLHQTVRALDLWDFGQGLLKAFAFALAIGLISCEQGLATEGGAEGVGRRTTAAVVKSLFALILLDAVITFAFHELGL